MLHALGQRGGFGAGIFQLSGQTREALGQRLVAIVELRNIAGAARRLGRRFAGARPLPGKQIVDLGAAASDRLGVLRR